MKRLIALVVFLMLLTTQVQADNDTIRFSTINWEPYAGESLPGRGITSAIISEACKRVGLKPSFHFLPWSRALAQTKDGTYDAVYNAYHSEKRARDYALSAPYFQTQLALCTRADRVIDYDGTVESLKPYKLGVVRSYVNTRAIDQNNEIEKDEAENDVLNLKKLIRGRVDLIVIDKYQALHLVKNNPTIEADTRDIRFLTPLLGTKKLYVMFSRKRPDWEKNLRLFNKGVQEIKTDGTLNEIMLRFGFSVPLKADE